MYVNLAHFLEEPAGKLGWLKIVHSFHQRIFIASVVLRDFFVFTPIKQYNCLASFTKLAHFIAMILI